MISQYLTRLVRKERIESGTFNTIVVSPVESRKPSLIWQGAENLNIEVPMNWADYEAAKGREEVNALFLSLFKEAFKRLGKERDFPVARLIDILHGFREGGYRNEWTFKRRLFREYGLKVALDCRLELDRFVLRVTITKAGVIVFEDDILTTAPDPLFWYHRFKDIRVRNGQVEIIGRNERQTEDGAWEAEVMFTWRIPHGLGLPH